MTTISASPPPYTPTVITAAPAVVTVPSVPDITPTDNSQTTDTVAAPVTATNADNNAPAVYTSLGDASASNIRGANLNTTA